MRKIPVFFNCNINDQAFTLSGSVNIKEGSGKCFAELNFDRSELPNGFEPEILSYVTITGYPAASYSEKNSINPFLDLSKDFQTQRVIEIPNVGKLKTIYFSENRGTDKESITFNVSGNISLMSKIKSISPVSEIWRHQKGGKSFKGEMTFTWKLENGESISGCADGIYNIDSKYPLTSDQIRIITFDLKTSRDGFIQHETIKLYNLEEWEKVILEETA